MATNEELPHRFARGDSAHIKVDGMGLDCTPVTVLAVSANGKTVRVLDRRLNVEHLFRLTTRKRGGTKFRGAGYVLLPGHRDYRDPSF